MKRIFGMIGIFLVVIMGYTAFAQNKVAQDAVDVSLIQLIATPEKYHGKRVRLEGFLRLEFEGNAIYLHREDYEHRIAKNGLWVDATKEMYKDRKKMDLHYVLIEGVFNAKSHGHMGLFSGEIEKINRSMLW